MRNTVFMRRYLLIIFLFCYQTTIFSQISVKKAPQWISDITLNTSHTFKKSDIQNGNLMLLYDNQVNIPLESHYYRFRYKITNESGIQSISEVSETYDPSYQKLHFHHIRIIRNGKTTNALIPNDFETMRIENNADSYIYDASLTSLTHLKDVRKGDIIDYAYTLVGRNPVEKGVYSSGFYLGYFSPIAQLHIKLIVEKPLNYKLFNTTSKPTITSKGPQQIFTWNLTNLKAVETENNTPSWHFDYPYVSLTEYDTWEEVVLWADTLFNQQQEPLSKALINEINNISKATKSKGEKISAVLNFVQDEIRYLGIESGIGNYKPFAPSKVYKQRFGDCKDKSLLMVNMLKRMNITAYPVLINTYKDIEILNTLPSPKVFDHCVVMVSLDSQKYYYDPTITKQGGDYKNTYFPNYKYGLIIDPKYKNLVEIPFKNNSKTSTFETYKLDSVKKGATLTVSTDYIGRDADAMRSYLENSDLSSINKNYENYYANYILNIKNIKDVEWSDDIDRNTLTVNELYAIDSLWIPDTESTSTIIAEFYTTSISDALSKPDRTDRKSPFALRYPLDKSHNITIQLPETWNIEKQASAISSPSFDYSYNVNYAKHSKEIILSHHFKTKKNVVPVSEIKDFHKKISKLENEIHYMISYNAELVNSNNSENQKLALQLGKIILLLLLLYVAYWVYTNYNPPSKKRNYLSEENKIGGWLILVGIGITISPFILFFQNINLTEDEYSSMIAFLSEHSENYSFGHGAMVFLIMFLNMSLFVYSILVAITFYTKRSSLPSLVVGYFALAIMIQLVDQGWVSALESDFDFIETDNNETFKELTKSIITLCIWGPYFFISNRVKATFTKQLNTKGEFA